MNRIEAINIQMGGGEASWGIGDLIRAGADPVDAAAWVIDEAMLSLRDELRGDGWSLELSDRVAEAVLAFVDANRELVVEAVGA